jgi:hypothetical protein
MTILSSGCDVSRLLSPFQLEVNCSKGSKVHLIVYIQYIPSFAGAYLLKYILQRPIEYGFHACLDLLNHLAFPSRIFMILFSQGVHNRRTEGLPSGIASRSVDLVRKSSTISSVSVAAAGSNQTSVQRIRHIWLKAASSKLQLLQAHALKTALAVTSDHQVPVI